MGTRWVIVQSAPWSVGASETSRGQSLLEQRLNDNIVPARTRLFPSRSRSVTRRPRSAPERSPHLLSPRPSAAGQGGPAGAAGQRADELRLRSVPTVPRSASRGRTPLTPAGGSSPRRRRQRGPAAVTEPRGAAHRPRSPRNRDARRGRPGLGAGGLRRGWGSHSAGDVPVLSPHPSGVQESRQGRGGLKARSAPGAALCPPRCHRRGQAMGRVVPVSPPSAPARVPGPPSPHVPRCWVLRGLYWSVLVCTCLHWFVLVCTGLHWLQLTRQPPWCPHPLSAAGTTSTLLVRTGSY